MSSDLAQLTPPILDHAKREAFFQYFYHQLAVHRNTTELYASTEYILSPLPEKERSQTRHQFSHELNRWAQELLKNAWIACQEPGGGDCPNLDEYADTSTGTLPNPPSLEDVTKLLNAILFLHVTTSQLYSARTRPFLSGFGVIDEHAIVATLKNPSEAIKEAERKTQETKDDHAERGKALRWAGVGLGAVAGGVLVGITGGLAAPLVGAGVSTVLGFLGVGGSAVGLLASGLASSSVVCTALFGAYGAKQTADMVSRYTREVQDIAIVPVHRLDHDETLAVRLCVSGWLFSPDDVIAPWTVFGGDDTFALQWEVEALGELASAFETLIKTHAVQYLKVEILKRTVLASLMSALSPIAWLKIGNIIDNPWMNSKQLAIKAGKVLGELLSSHVFGKRPVTLCGYSLGSLVIFEALKFLATLPPSQTANLIQDVFLFGTPAPTDESTWSGVRRVVCGRLVNGFAKDDYILAILSRASDASWGVAGLQAVQVKGVENVECEGVDGHLKWRGLIGRCLKDSGAPGIMNEEVEIQLVEVADAESWATGEPREF
jgi:hypothetical protein